MQDEKQYAEKVHANWAKKVFASLPDAFVDTCLGFESFEKILASSGTIGVTRLIRCPAFGGIDGVTIVFKQSEAHVTTATSSQNPNDKLTAPIVKQVNSKIPNWELLAKRFSVEEAEKGEKCLPIHSLHPPFNSWLDTKAAIELAPDCMTPTFDGYAFFHSAGERGWKATSTWSNPRHDLTPVQAKLVDAYRTLLPSIIR